MSEKLGLGLIISSAKIKEDVSLLLRSLRAGSLVGRVSLAKEPPVLGSLSRTQTSEPARRLIVALPSVLNEFFPSVGQTLAASVPPATHHFSDYLPAVNSPSSFFFKPVTSMELENEILLLPINKSHIWLILLSCSRIEIFQ